MRTQRQIHRRSRPRIAKRAFAHRHVARCSSQYSENETQAELLRIAAQNARQLSRLIDDLFDASRLASGKLQLRRETIDMRNIAEQSIQAVTPATINVAKNCM